MPTHKEQTEEGRHSSWMTNQQSYLGVEVLCSTLILFIYPLFIENEIEKVLLIYQQGNRSTEISIEDKKILTKIRKKKNIN